MNSTLAMLVVFCAGASITCLPAAAVTIPTVPVGNAGNGNDTTGYGDVSYDYRIGTYEVTVGQYAEFLNAVATTDTYLLYNPAMGGDLNIAGIARSGSSGSYSYSAIGSANKPVTYVSWGDAVRFANWLHNGQPTGMQVAATTEDGAYTLNGAITDEDLNAVSRNSGATWFLTSADEWYKAAYHQNDGATSNYWTYPTGSNSVPVSEPPAGGANSANFWDGTTGFAATGSNSYDNSQNYLTDAGAYSLSASPYGTFDQGGNVWEWNEALMFGAYRGLRGGSWNNGSPALLASLDDYVFQPNYEFIGDVGFRVATVPEPSTFVLAAVGIIGLMACARRRRSCLRP